MAVTTFRPGEADDASKVAVTGAGSEVYSSTDRLYVTSTDWRAGRSCAWSRTRPRGRDAARPGRSEPRTYIHAFALDGDSTRYVASGSVDGTIRDRWSLDEHDGHLRVAVSWLDRTGSSRSDNGIVVLDEHGGRLEQVGALHGLGVGEQIQSVRWFDDLAVVVTFRQIDPLYTIDLERPDPSATPRRAEDPRLLLLPAPDRRRPAARHRQRRHRAPASSSERRPRCSTSPTPATHARSAR